MFYSLDISYPEERIAQNKKRWDAAHRFTYIDRVGVFIGVSNRFFLKKRGVGYREFFKSPEDFFVNHLQNLKYYYENVADDGFMAPELAIAPNFDNVPNASACGCEVEILDDQPPRAYHWMKHPDEIDSFEVPRYDSGLWGTMLQWYERFKELAKETKVTLNGKEIPLKVSCAIDGESPFMMAVEIVGTSWYTWLYEYPEACHKLLDKLTTAFINAQTYFRKASGQDIASGAGIADDSAQIISPAMFKEFVVPYTGKIYDTFSNAANPRSMHMCGRNVHLHESLLNDLRITEFWGYGTLNKPEEMKKYLAGNVVLVGNIDPVLIENGPKEEIRKACMEVLDVLAEYGGIILCDGFNVGPETPLDNIQVLMDCANEYGLPEITKRAQE